MKDGSKKTNWAVAIINQMSELSEEHEKMMIGCSQH